VPGEPPAAVLVGRPELQRVVGARGLASETLLLFFTGSDYASTAVAYADEMGIALFHYALDGSMTAVNAAARRIAGPSVEQRPRPAPARERNGFWRSNWRLVAGVLFVLSPLGSIGDSEVTTPGRGTSTCSSSWRGSLCPAQSVSR
jgi:hypothetical protein